MSSYKSKQAHRAIKRFGDRFGQAHLDFAAHAALPLVLSPDLLYAIWFNFNEDIDGRPLNIPWIAVADLLLASFCQEIGHELYAIDTLLRETLVQRLVDDERFGLQRARQVAQFLDQYAERFFTSPDLDEQEVGQAQRLAAYAYANPQQLVTYLDTVYQRPLHQAQMIRLAGLVEAVSYPVNVWHEAAPETKAQFARAQTISHSLGAYARGDVDTAVSTLQSTFTTPAEIAIRDTAVSLPAGLQNELNREAGPNAVADMRTFFADFVRRQLYDVSHKLEVALRSVARWLADPANAPLLVITGQPGSGKTELAVNIVKTAQDAATAAFPTLSTSLGAYHFCREDRPETLDPRLFARSLSRQLAEHDPDFAAALAETAVPDSNASLDELLAALIIDPLNRQAYPSNNVRNFSQTAPTPPPSISPLVLVDDLDVATAATGELTILDVCLRLQTAVPQLRFLLTTRFSSPVREALDGATYATYTLDVIYQNFDLRIQDAGTKRQAYEVSILAAPVGELQRPRQLYDTESLVRRILDELRHVHPGTPRQPIGADLFRTFFAGEVESLFRASYERVRQVGERLRLRLFLPDPTLAALPWEWLYDKELGFLAQQESISLVRGEPPTAVFRTRANPTPLKILLATTEPPIKSLFEPGEWAARLRSELSSLSRQTDVTILEHTSPDALARSLLNEPAHVLHLAAPFQEDRDGLWLLLEESGRARPLAINELASILQGGDVALVLLTAVNDEQWSPMLKAARRLVEAGIPAVLAWPSLVRQQWELLLASFYENLAAGAPLDEAVADLRRASAAAGEGDAAGSDLALFTSTPHGNVWRSELTAVDLYEALTEHFTLFDLKELCFTLPVNYADLAGEGRRGKMVELVALMQRQNRLQELALAILDIRPHANFAYRPKEATPPTPTVTVDPTALRQWLDTYFNLEEIRLLCFELDFDFDTLSGETRRETADALVANAERHSRLPELQAYILRERPLLAPEQPPTATPDPPIDPVALYRLLTETFNLDQLQDLALEVNIWFDDLAGEMRSAKARELVLYMQRHGRLAELNQAMQRFRPQPTPPPPQMEEPAVPKSVTPTAESITIGGVQLPQQGISETLAPMLADSFDLEELRTLSFELRVDYENLRGETLADKARSLIDETQNQNKLADLTELVTRQRPRLGYDDYTEAA